MKKTILAVLVLSTTLLAKSQNFDQARLLVLEGVKLHDKGQYKQAIEKYDRALEFDYNNLNALAEKAFSLMLLQNFEEAANCCEKAISSHQGAAGLKTVYVTYGNCFDALGKPEKSLKIYDEGLSLFPEAYQLYYNKGVTFLGQKNYEEALTCFETAVKKNPTHASSHSGIARTLLIMHKDIPSIMAYCRFFSLELNSARAIQNFSALQYALPLKVGKGKKKNSTIYLSDDDLIIPKDSSKKVENSFGFVKLTMSILDAVDLEGNNKKKSDAELFERSMNNLCKALSQQKAKNSGFYWEYYAPYFMEMQNNKLITVFSKLVYSVKKDKKSIKWLKANSSEVDRFYEWSNSFIWNTL